jgi:hypothetical protein
MATSALERARLAAGTAPAPAPKSKGKGDALATDAASMKARIAAAVGAFKGMDAAEQNTALAIRPFLVELSSLYGGKAIPSDEVDLIVAEKVAGRTFKNDESRRSTISQERKIVANSHVMLEGVDLYAQLAVEFKLSPVPSCPVYMAKTIARRYADDEANPDRDVASVVGKLIAERVANKAKKDSATPLDKCGEACRKIVRNLKYPKDFRVALNLLCKQHSIPIDDVP